MRRDNAVQYNIQTIGASTRRYTARCADSLILRSAHRHCAVRINWVPCTRSKNTTGARSKEETQSERRTTSYVDLATQRGGCTDSGRESLSGISGPHLRQHRHVVPQGRELRHALATQTGRQTGAPGNTGPGRVRRGGQRMGPGVHQSDPTRDPQSTWSRDTINTPRGQNRLALAEGGIAQWSGSIVLSACGPEGSRDRMATRRPFRINTRLHHATSRWL